MSTRKTAEARKKMVFLVFVHFNPHEWMGTHVGFRHSYIVDCYSWRILLWCECMSACAIDADIYCLEALVVLLLHSRLRRCHLHEIFGNDARTSYNVSWDLYSLCLCAYLSRISKAILQLPEHNRAWPTMGNDEGESNGRKKWWRNKNKYAEQ